MVPVRSATEKRDGTWSGNTSDSFNKAASGNMCRASRSVANNTAVDVASRATSHSPRPVRARGEAIILKNTADQINATTIGIVNTTTRIPAATTGWPRHDLSCC